MRALAVLAALALLAACPRGRAASPDEGPLAEPAPVEIDWPDAGAPPVRAP